MESRMESWHLNGYSDSFEFETGRIKELKTERLNIQQKTFTKWINSFLMKSNYEVTNIFTDLSDGRLLMRLLEIISGEKLGRPSPGKLRVHKIENVNRCLAFLHTKVRLESIGAEDIVDGNERLILGLIWTIILRFQIQEIEIDVAEEDESTEKRSARDALLLWCQRRLRGYHNVHIRDFSSSWRDGLGFNALIHSQNPELINFADLNPHDHLRNLNLAFNVAEVEYGITKLLDAEDIDVPKPDDKSVLTYISSYYHCFSKLSKEHKGAKRICNIISKIKAVDEEQRNFDLSIDRLLAWIKKRTEDMKDRGFPNSVQALQQILKELNVYFVTEKPRKCREKVEIEAKYFIISSTANRLQKVSFSGNAKRVQEINQLWSLLEKEENRRKSAIRDELIRQEKLEQTASNFYRKSRLRGSYITEMTVVLSDPRYGTNLAQVSASLRKHKAIAADISSRAERLQTLENMVSFLCKEKFHDSQKVLAQFKDIQEKWKFLLAKVAEQNDKLTHYEKMTNLLSDCDSIEESMLKLRRSVVAVNGNDENISAMEHLQKLTLLDTDLKLLEESIKSLDDKVLVCQKSNLAIIPGVVERLQAIKEHFKETQASAGRLRQKLEDSLLLEKIIYDLEEIHLWIYEKIQVTNIVITTLNQASINREKEKQRMLEHEVQTWYAKLNSLKGVVENIPSPSDELSTKLATIETDWKHLREISGKRSHEIDCLLQLFTFGIEVNDSKSWLRSVIAIINSYSSCQNRSACQSQLQRLKELRKQAEAIKPEVSGQHQRVMEFLEDYFSSRDKTLGEEGQVRERVVPQVKALYGFTSKDIDMKKGEVMFLIARNNNDWWSVRKFNGVVGFVPRNYVTEVKPKNILVQVQEQKESSAEIAIKNLSLEQTAKSNLDLSDEVENLIKQKESVLLQYCRYFDYVERCDGALSWIKSQAQILTSCPVKVNLAGRIEKYGGSITSLAQECATLCQELPGERQNLKKNQSEVENEYSQLTRSLRRYCDEETISIQTDLILKEFEETVLWVNKKRSEIDYLFSDAETVQPERMLRKIKAIECELEPLSEKIGSVCMKLHQTKKHEDNVSLLQNSLRELENRLTSKEASIKQALVLQDLKNNCTSYIRWADGQTKYLVNDIKAMDLNSAESTLSRVEVELEEKDVIYQAIASQCEANPDLRKKANVGDVIAAKEALIKAWQTSLQQVKRSGQQLQYKKDHRSLKLELDQLNKLAGSEYVTDEAEYELGSRVGKAMKQLEKLREAKNNGDVDEVDFAKDSIDDLWSEVESRYEKRQFHIGDRKAYQDFDLSLVEMEAFIDAKSKLARDTSTKGKASLLYTTNQHKLMENEIRVNASQIKLINLVGNKLSRSDNAYAEEIKSGLTRINSKWDDLLDSTAKKRRHLESSLARIKVEEELLDLSSEILELENSLRVEPPSSQAECRMRLSQFDFILGEVAALKRKLESVSKDASNLTSTDDGADSWDAEMAKKIRLAEQKLSDILENLQDMTVACHESSKAFEYMMELDSELWWIGEKQSAVKLCKEPLQKDGRLQNQIRKLVDEICSHEPKIVSLLERADEFQDNRLKPNVVGKCQTLEAATKNISQEKDHLLQHHDYLKKFNNVLADLTSIENWCEEKRAKLSSSNFGSDENSVLDLLKKHKIIELEIDCYDGIAREVSTQIRSQLTETPEDHLNQQLIAKNSHVQAEFQRVNELAKERGGSLLGSLQYFEYIREADDFSQWMVEQRSVLNSMNSDAKLSTWDDVERAKVRLQNQGIKMAHGEKNFTLCRNIFSRLSGIDAEQPKTVVPSGQSAKIFQELETSWLRLRADYEKVGQNVQRRAEYLSFLRELQDYNDLLSSKMILLSPPFDGNKSAVQLRLQKIKGFLQDVASLESHLERLANEATKSFKDSREIAALLNKAGEMWDTLERMTDVAKDSLNLSNNYFVFLSDCDELLQWMKVMGASFPESNDISSVQASQSYMNELEAIRIEINSKEERFRDLLERSEALKAALDNGRSRNVEEKLQMTISDRQDLHMLWQKRKVELDQKIDYQFFTRDVSQAMSFYSTLEGQASKDERLESVDVIENSLRQLAVTQRSMEAHASKAKSIKTQGLKLMEQGHSKSKDVQQAVEALFNKRNKVQELIMAKHNSLRMHKMCQLFVVKADDRIEWMEGKTKKYSEVQASSTSFALPKQLDEVRKFQSLESDVLHTRQEMSALIDEGSSLQKSSVGREYGIGDRVVHLETVWNSLQDAGRHMLAEMDMLAKLCSMEKALEKIEFWIRNGAYLGGGANDVGSDLEHCLELEKRLATEGKKFESFHLELKDLKRDSEEKNMSKSPLKQRISEASKDMAALQLSYQKYNAKLEMAKKGHTLYRDLYDLYETVNEKSAFLEKMSDVAVSSPQDHTSRKNKLEETLKFTSNSKKQLQGLMNGAGDKLGVFSNGEQIGGLAADLEGLLQRTEETCVHKLRELDTSRNQWALLRNLKNASIILQKHQLALQGIGDFEDVEQASAVVQKAEEKLRSTDLNAERGDLQLYQDHALLLGEFEKLSDGHKDLSDLTISSRQLLESKQRAYFVYRKIADLSSWIKQCEAKLSITDVGNFLTETRSYLARATGLELELQQQEKVLRDVLQEESISPVETKSLETKFKDICKQLVSRKDELLFAERCHLAMNGIDRVKAVIDEKWQLAIEGAVTDLEDVSEKSDKHTELKANVLSMSPKVEEVKREIQDLLHDDHSKLSVLAPDVEKRHTEVSREWEQLNDQLLMTDRRLADAQVSIQLLDGLARLSKQVTEAKIIVQAEWSNDIKKVKDMITKFDGIDKDIILWKNQIVVAERETASAADAQNAFASILQENLGSIKEEIASLESTAQERKSALENYATYLQLSIEAGAQLLWLAEKLTQVQTDNLDFDNLLQVESTLKRLRLVKAEINARTPSIDNLASECRGESLKNQAYCEKLKLLAQELSTKVKDLTGQLNLIFDLLEDSLRTEHFLLDCQETLAWITERDTFLSQSLKTEDELLLSCLTKVQGFGTEMDKEDNSLAELEIRKKDLLRRTSLNSKRIEHCFGTLSTSWKSLRQRVARTSEQLGAKLDYVQKLRESEELLQAITRLSLVASDENYGKNLNDVSKLLEDFNEHEKEGEVIEKRVANFASSIDGSFAGAGSDSQAPHFGRDLRKKADELNSLWEEVKELSEARREALQGAKLVHSFDKSVDQVKELIVEKKAVFSQLLLSHEEEGLLIAKDVLSSFQIDDVVNQVRGVESASQVLLLKYSDASNHISARLKELRSMLSTFQAEYAQIQAQVRTELVLIGLQKEYRDWMAWITEMITIVTSNELAKTLIDGIYLLQKHDEIMSDADSRLPSLNTFCSKCRDLTPTMDQKSAGDVLMMVKSITSHKDFFLECWQSRKTLYAQHLDYLKWKSEINTIEMWLNENEKHLQMHSVGESIEDVEELLARHAELEELLGFENDRVDKICRMTIIESQLQLLKEKEESNRQKETYRKQQEAEEALKRRENLRATREKKRAEERRRTQEIILPPRPAAAGDDGKVLADLGNGTFAGFLERKQEYEDGRKRSSSRSWKTFYAVLQRDLIMLFPEKESFESQRAPLFQISLINCKIEVPENYTKKNFVFRVIASNGAESLFNVQTKEEQRKWISVLLDGKSLNGVENGAASATKTPSKDKKSVLDKILHRRSKS